MGKIIFNLKEPLSEKKISKKLKGWLSLLFLKWHTNQDRVGPHFGAKNIFYTKNIKRVYFKGSANVWKF